MFIEKKKKKAPMRLIPRLEFVFGRRKPLHLPLKCIHFWGGMHQLFPSLRRHARQFRAENEASYPRQIKLVGKFQVDRMQLPKLKLGQGHIRRPFPSVGEKDHQILTRASGQDLSSRSHLKGRHLKNAKGTLYLV